MRDNNGYRVSSQSATLAMRLRAAGFATGAFVGAFPLDQRFGLGQGFDVYDDRISEVGTTVDFQDGSRPTEGVTELVVTDLMVSAEKKP